MSRTHVTCTVNGDEVDFLAADDTSLLDALREELGLTGAKEGCGTGDCGACSILLDGRLNCSCLVFAPEAEGRDIVTVEGLADGDHLHTETEIRYGLAGNLCRCTGYDKIVRAVQEAAVQLNGAGK